MFQFKLTLGHTTSQDLAEKLVLNIGNVPYIYCSKVTGTRHMYPAPTVTHTVLTGTDMPHATTWAQLSMRVLTASEAPKYSACICLSNK